MLDLTLDIAAQDLDEARAKIQATREALQAVLDARGEDQPGIRQLIEKLDGMAAEVVRIESVVVGKAVGVGE